MEKDTGERFYNDHEERVVIPEDGFTPAGG